jgi:hypothetical protein
MGNVIRLPRPPIKCDCGWIPPQVIHASLDDVEGAASYVIGVEPKIKLVVTCPACGKGKFGMTGALT